MIDSQKQLSRHRQRDNRQKQILSPNLAADQRRGMKDQTPNQDWQILGLGFPHTNRGPFVSPGDSLESRSQSSEASRLHGTIAGGGCIRPYVEDEGKVICHTRTRAHITHQLTTLMLDAAFITKGYTIWKDAGFSQHERSQCYREAVERSIALHATTKDAGEHISSTREEDKANSRKPIINMLSNIRFLGRRGIPYRCVVTGMEIILTSHILSTFELKTNQPFSCGWSRKPTRVYLQADAKQDADSNDTRSSHRCRSFPPQYPVLLHNGR